MGKSRFKKAIASLEAPFAEHQLQLSELSDLVLLSLGKAIAVLLWREERAISF
jgi:hypothetical protein